MQGFFRPEMLNRLDEVVVFRQLMRPQVSPTCTAGTHTAHPSLSCFRSGLTSQVSKRSCSPVR